MYTKNTLTALLAAATVVKGFSISRDVSQEPHMNLARALELRQNNQGGNGDPSCLNDNVIATGSASDGNAAPKDGQSASATDKFNFINFCSGQTITNGLQNKAGSCNPIVMGKIPSVENMISAVITNPPNGQTIDANKDFDVVVQTQGLKAGSFTNAQETYYSAPQDLDGSGKIIGHCHVTVQKMQAADQTTPLNPQLFDFFKGINDDGNGQGLLKATVTGGLPEGVYRVCTMISSSNHQPVIMTVAQRGAQDDCIRFTVGNAGNAANGAQNGQAQNGQGQNGQGQNGQGQNGQGQNGQGQNGQAQNGQAQNAAQNGGQNGFPAGFGAGGFGGFDASGLSKAEETQDAEKDDEAEEEGDSEDSDDAQAAAAAQHQNRGQGSQFGSVFRGRRRFVV